MSKNAFPHKQIHIRFATENFVLPTHPNLCHFCLDLTKVVVLHHDHLANYSRYRLRSELNLFGLGHLFQRYWNDIPFINRLLRHRRFDPIYVCQTCNEGDGWAKAPGWRGMSKPLYPPSFSMTPSEMRTVRKAKIHGDHENEIRRIWKEVECDHWERRGGIDKCVKEYLPLKLASASCAITKSNR